MFKILILLTFPYLLFANCDYSLKYDIKFDVSDEIREKALSFVEKEMLDKKYKLISISKLTLNLSSTVGPKINRFNVETILELYTDGSLDIYSYGQGRGYKSLDRAKSLRNIKRSLRNAIKQIPSCEQ